MSEDAPWSPGFPRLRNNEAVLSPLNAPDLTTSDFPKKSSDATLRVFARLDCFQGSFLPSICLTVTTAGYVSSVL